MTDVLIFAAIVVAIGLRVWMSVRRARRTRIALDRNGPPGSLRWWLIVVAFAVVLAAVTIARISDNRWWMLLALPGLVIVVFVRLHYTEPSVESAGA